MYTSLSLELCYFTVLACVNMSKIGVMYNVQCIVYNVEIINHTSTSALRCGEYRSRTDDLLHAMQAL